ncbi:MAG: UDP-glucose 4-epimerase GalE [Desulfobacterales bacterium]
MSSPHILVVGGAGYIGSHMVKALLEAGFWPVTLDNLSRGHRELVPGGEFIEGDLSDTVLLDRLFSRFPIDAVLHFAADSLVGESVTRPLQYYRNNVAGTLGLVEAMVRNDVDALIFSSTAAVYGEPGAAPISETHPCRPTNPYGATKLAVERMLADCEAAYGLRSISLRYFNAAGAHESGTIGERHRPETHLIPLVLETAAGLRDRIRIFGEDYPTPDGTCVRDYIHVSDLAQAHLLALERLLNGAAGAVYNLGNSKGYSVREVIDSARRITGRPIDTEPAERRPGDPAVLVAASDRARGELGWRPRYESLETIVETAWAWHLHEIDG